MRRLAAAAVAAAVTLPGEALAQSGIRALGSDGPRAKGLGEPQPPAEQKPHESAITAAHGDEDPGADGRIDDVGPA